jgi:hypothetical protein
VGGGSMRLKTFQEREYCGEREIFFVEQILQVWSVIDKAAIESQL